jgi:hypothetical protein
LGFNGCKTLFVLGALLCAGFSVAQEGAVKNKTARVLGVSGDVQASIGSVSHPVHSAQTLGQGTRVVVAPGGFVSLQLVDGSIVRLYSDSSVLLETLPSDRPAEKKGHSTVLFLDKGSLDAEVVRKQSVRRSFEIKSRLAVASVRGTRFGVTVQENDGFTGDVQRGRVQVNVAGAQKGRPFADLRPGRGVSVDPNTGLGETFNLLRPVPDVPIAPLVIDESAFLRVAYSALTGAKRYQFQIARDESMVHVVRNGVFDKPEALFAGLPVGPYFVSVRALDAAGARGVESVQPLIIRRRAAPPLLLIPAVGAVPNERGLVLRCGQVEGALGYHVQLATDVDFKNTIIDRSDSPDCLALVPSDLSGLVYWRVAVNMPISPGERDKSGAQFVKSPWSSVMQLQLSPGFVQQTKFVEKVINPSPLTKLVRYRVQIALDSGFVNVVRDQVLPDAVLPLDLPGGQYHVRWKGVMPDQTESEFSVPQVVMVNATR